MGPIFRLGNRPRFIALWIAAGVIFKSLAAWETVTNLSVSILGVIFSETEFFTRRCGLQQLLLQRVYINLENFARRGLA
jgi:hypothetical protein